MTTSTGHTAVSHPREFTMPGEWERAARRADGCLSGTTGIGDSRAEAPHIGGISSADPAGPPGDRVTPAAPDGCTDSPPGEQVIIGPVVAGPTIPVVPAGADHDEPHTDLEDPTTIPHPGSVEINTYRALRDDTRRHALRRIRRIAPLDPNRDSAAEAERAELDRAYRIARAFRRTESDVTAQPPTPRPAFLPPDVTDLPELPPF